MGVICKPERHPKGCRGGAGLHLLEQGLPRRINGDRSPLRVTLVTAWMWPQHPASLGHRQLPAVGVLLPGILHPQLQGWCVNLTHLLDLSLGLESQSQWRLQVKWDMKRIGCAQFMVSRQCRNQKRDFFSRPTVCVGW